MQVDYIFCYKATVNLRNAYRSERELRSIVSLYAAISVSVWENGLYPIYRSVSEVYCFMECVGCSYVEFWICCFVMCYCLSVVCKHQWCRTNYWIDLYNSNWWFSMAWEQIANLIVQVCSKLMWPVVLRECQLQVILCKVKLWNWLLKTFSIRIILLDNCG